MNKKIEGLISNLDELLSDNYVRFFREKNSLITFLFHGLFKNKEEIEINCINPQQKITVDKFRQFIDYYLANNYLFVTPQDILNGLNPEKKYVLITFDDGYFNNHISLPVLQEFKVPATFFISTNHVIDNKCFWWDVIYRERTKRNIVIDQIRLEYSLLKKMKHDQIERYLINNFGAKVLNPVSDIDRPFNPEELKAFSKEPFVHLGNHTANHAILTNYSYNEIENEIRVAQNSLFSITGLIPVIIAYPSDNWSEEVLTIAKDTGLKLGITVNTGKNLLPINLEGFNPFLIKRFTLWGDKDIRKQCARVRSDIHFKEAVDKILLRRRNKKRDSY